MAGMKGRRRRSGSACPYCHRVFRTIKQTNRHCDTDCPKAVFPAGKKP